MNKVGKRTVTLLVLALGTWALFLLLTPLVGPAWQLFNGHSVLYEGWRLPVPKGFYVRTQLAGPTMWRPTLGVPFWDAPYGHISVFPLPNGRQPFVYATDFQQFNEGVSQEAERAGFRLRSQHSIAVGNKTGTCLEFSSSASPRVLARCAVDGAPMVFFYEGDRRFFADFISMLQEMSPRA